jgi:hypothetical protein
MQAGWQTPLHLARVNVLLMMLLSCRPIARGTCVCDESLEIDV